MIEHVDNLLRNLFMTRIAEVNDEERVRFQPPDEGWRQHVANQGGNALNVYLVDLRENRKLRSNERTREIQNGIVSETPAPRRVDCHYLITAWSPAVVTPGVEPTVDEHALLYKVTAALTKNEPLVPRKVYEPAPLPATFPEVLADAQLPTSLLPVEGFPKYAEFWGTMGQSNPWRPAVYLVVTLPVTLQTEIAGAMVTTRIAEFRVSGQPSTGEVWIEIGGHVRDSAFKPVSDAWVELQAPAGERAQLVQTDEQGRFAFNRLRPGKCRLIASAAGFTTTQRDVDVPSPSGEYDLQF